MKTIKTLIVGGGTVVLFFAVLAGLTDIVVELLRVWP